MGAIARQYYVLCYLVCTSDVETRFIYCQWGVFAPPTESGPRFGRGCRIPATLAKGTPNENMAKCVRREHARQWQKYIGECLQRRVGYTCLWEKNLSALARAITCSDCPNENKHLTNLVVKSQ